MQKVAEQSCPVHVVTFRRFTNSRRHHRAYECLILTEGTQPVLVLTAVLVGAPALLEFRAAASTSSERTPIPRRRSRGGAQSRGAGSDSAGWKGARPSAGVQPVNLGSAAELEAARGHRGERGGLEEPSAAAAVRTDGGAALTHVSSQRGTGAGPPPLGTPGPPSRCRLCPAEGSPGWRWWFLLKPAPVGADALVEAARGTWRRTGRILTASSAPPAAGT